MPLTHTLNHRDVSVVIATTFPGVAISVQDRIGGAVCRASIWQFHMEASITTIPVAISDKAGNVRCSLLFKPTGTRTVTIYQVNCVTVDEIRAFTEWVRGYLNGILAAITIACEGSGPVNLMDEDEA